MRRRKRRYKEPIFSTKFTLFLILLAVVTAGIALYTVLNTYPGAAGAGSRLPTEHEDTTNEPETIDNEPRNDANVNEAINTPGETPDTGPDDVIDSGYSENTNETTPDEAPPDEVPPDETIGDEIIQGQPDIVLFTQVDNSQLPWYLKLVNRYNSLDYYFVPQLMSVGGGQYFDARAGDALLRMLDSARADGLSPVVISSFRSISHQTNLFNSQVQRHIDAGYNADDAFEAARRVVAYPGTSEHNLGLAVDIVASSYRGLTAAQAYTPEGIWLAENSYRYGFVLRYPYYHQHITNIIFEPWHFRYVGVYAATEMFERGLVLEEFVSERLAQ